MIETLKKHIAENGLITQGEKILLGVSGGPDSVVMTDMLHKIGIKFGIAHVNFQLRDAESDADEQFVRELAHKYGVAIHVRKYDTTMYAEQKGLSIEMAARELRYKYFDELMDTYGYTATAVAHHRDDAIETFFLNLTRGAGIRGLTGIKVTNGRIIRPLLCYSRKEIEKYAKENSLNYRVDHTNLESKFARNKVRNLVIPILEKINPSARNAITESILYLSMARHIYEKSIGETLLKVERQTENTTYIDINGILSFVEPSCLLHEILSRYGFSKAQCVDVMKQINGPSGKKFYSDTHLLEKDRNSLIISKLSNETEHQSHPVLLIWEDDILSGVFCSSGCSLSFSIINNKDFLPERNPNVAYFDYNKLTFPLELTGWEAGDRFVPFGAKYSKKLSDLFVDNKISLLKKRRTPILRCGDDILWVVGIRASNYRIVDQETKQILKITSNSLE